MLPNYNGDMRRTSGRRRDGGHPESERRDAVRCRPSRIRRCSTCCATIFELNGAKFGCGLAQCGACTVLVDGKAVRSCVTADRLARRAPRSRRSKGLGTLEKPHALQRAFIDEQAAQCGYCISGMIMSAKALLDRNPKPSEDDVRAGACRQSLPLRHAQPHRPRGAARRAARWGGRDMNASAHPARLRQGSWRHRASPSRSIPRRRCAATAAAARQPATATGGSTPGSASMPTAPRRCSPARSSSGRAS